MKNKDANWSIERKHNVTGEVFYLSPGQVNWVSVQQHEKYGTRYGRWIWDDAVNNIIEVRQRNPVDFTYVIRPFLKVTAKQA